MISGNKRSEKEYRRLETLSASDLKTFATEDRRTFFKKCILKQKDEDEEPSRSAKIGSLVHCMLLEPAEFDNKFFMSLCSSPPTGLMEKFVDNLYRHTMANTDESGEVLMEFSDLAKLAYRDSGYKISLEAVIKNFKDKEPELYYRERRACGNTGKELICIADRNIAEKVVENLKYHEYTKDIFGINSLKETQIEKFEIDGLPLKAMIDDIEDLGNKVIVTDLKVTWTNEDFFREYFLKRRADIQAYVYKQAVSSLFPGKEVQFRFVVADSTNFNDPLIYEIDDSWDDKTYGGFKYDNRHYIGLHDIIESIKWHTSTNNWTVSKTAFDNLGIIRL